MNVLQINTVGSYGSTGKNAVDIADELIKYNVNSMIAYGQRKSLYEHSFNFGIRIENIVHSVLGRLTGLQGFYSWIGTMRLLRFADRFKPDLIHVNNLHGNYICFPMLVKYIVKNRIPVVVTMHDCWYYTGNCAHYVSIGCDKWKSGCGNCPNIHLYPNSLLFDTSRMIYRKKCKSYKAISNIRFVAVSDWIANEFKRSMFSEYSVCRIYNWVDSSVFSPDSDNDEAVLDKYGLIKDQEYILGVCGRWSESKGIKDWMKIAHLLDKNIPIVLIGNYDDEYMPERLMNNIRMITYVDSATELAAIYRNSLLFLNLSEAESFGKTTAEALSSGIPVIVYDTTACPELVGPNCGYVVPLHDISGVVNCINEVCNNGKDYYSKYCRDFALENFDKKTNIGYYYNVYKEMVNGE